MTRVSIAAEAAAHARATYPSADWPHIAEVVSYALQLARPMQADEEIVTLAAYFHDISRATMGPEEHHVRSAEIARDWLTKHGYPAQRTERVAAAITVHMLPVTGADRNSVPLEGRILYDADKISRAQGLAVPAVLARLGQQTSWDNLTYAQLAAAIRQARQATEEAFASLYTDTARKLAVDGYRRTIAFCDGLLEMRVFRGQESSSGLG